MTSRRSDGQFHIAAFYRFVELHEHADLVGPLTRMCALHGTTGTILVAPEGVNGTIAGSRDGVDSVLDHLRSDPRLADLEAKTSTANSAPFLRMKVRLKKEIVSLGVGPVDVVANTGTRIPPDAWNEVISDPDVVVVDTRNDYEVAVGTFRGAISPATASFTEFPEWVANAPELADKPPIAMFCTGGIRCEKASAYLRDQGFDTVFQLDGGVLKYLETVKISDSAWEGECYVFDRRVSVGHDLIPGDYESCPNCSTALDAGARRSPKYVKGVACEVCADTTSDDRRRRFTERQSQIDLAEARGQHHLGQVPGATDSPATGIQ